MPPLHALIGAWSPDFLSLTLILVIGAEYQRMARRSGEPTAAQAWSFGTGLAVWALATLSGIAVYAPVLFWMRALQVLLLLFVVPFLLAIGRPVATLRAGSSPSGRRRIDGLLASRPARLLCSPAVTSAMMLATPWLLYLTPWYVASLTNGVVAALTRIALLLIGFGYFYARLQSDPVPRRYSPLLSILISVAETLGDGLLGLVLWLGPLIARDYYAALGRNWGPSMRTDQTVGAGILWILGDIVGLPFLLMLMRALGSHEKAVADEADAADPAGHVEVGSDRRTLWWEEDPQLRDRFRSR
ncbi:cytochrome c oxidase assembly protein [Mycobacterium sp. URHB0044]|uniref:cytochrome c oxidase assembly protein n=1 Tax=Mycobacterium sp. URHB0044 TaxID=1380386 RepID=UPI00068457E0